MLIEYVKNIEQWASERMPILLEEERDFRKCKSGKSSNFKGFRNEKKVIVQKF